jgi:NAD(P)-dependent dehydrogenase (short-subunit alcohol dehydrogenase family)
MRAVITGAASGIGRSVALRLNADSIARDGSPARMVLADWAAKPLEAVAAELRDAGAEVELVVADLSDPEAPARVIEAANKYDGIDALISNAGIIHRATLLELTLEDYERTFAINTRPTWLLAKAAHPLLKVARGAIVATASIAAYEPTPALGVYSSSKAALLMLIRQIACDWGHDGIRANSVSPGSTNTNISKNAGIDTVPAANRVANNPLGFIAEPDDQSAVIAFLVSPGARFITGTDIVVDGGARTQLMVVAGMGDPLKRAQIKT